MFLRVDLYSDIEFRTRAKRKLRVAKQYHIQFSVGDTLKSTKNARKKKNRISWDDVLYLWVHIHVIALHHRMTLVSDGDDRTAFLMTIYKKYDVPVPFKPNEVVVGGIADTIGGILEKSNNGGTKALYSNAMFY